MRNNKVINYFLTQYTMLIRCIALFDFPDFLPLIIIVS